MEVEVNRLPSRDGLSSIPLSRRSGYKIFCFAEDDWIEQATVGSVNFAAPSSRNKVTFASVTAFKDLVGTATTLDLTPPNLTLLDVAATEDRIVVSVSMDEAGTVWCRAYRKGAAMPLAPEILETGFYVESPAEAMAEVNITAENAKGDPLAQGTDYEVYCYAEDVPCLRCSVAAGSSVEEIRKTQAGIRTLDVLPPRVTVLFAEALSKDTIQPGVSTGFEEMIKGANCTESHPPQRPCGSFWIYDLDDVEDTPLDGVSTVQDLAASYQYTRDVQITLFGLTEATVYDHIYCFAEDDEVDGLGSAPNKMYYDTSDAPAGTESSRLVSSVKAAVGSIVTLDESPATFTQLEILDPTVQLLAEEGLIAVSLALNEPGTAYCRVTRSDSGEVGSDMHVNRILAAGWSAVHAGPPADAVTINITALDSAVPLDVPSVPVEAATQYDAYCWAQDNAVSTLGFARPNYMTQQYVTSPVVSPSSPSGGATAGIWVTDKTPPTIIYVSSEAVSSDTLQVTLQLDEPGTIWCAAAEPDSSANTQNCREGELQDSQPDPSIEPCYFETFAKGTYADGTVFKAEVSQPFRDVDIEISRIWERNGTSTSKLQPETPYKIFCFAEDDWVVQSTAGAVSPNFAAPTSPNKSPLSQGQSLLAAIGTRTTLDESPPRFAKLLIQNPTQTNDRIVVVFALNEPGTAYCRARRVDSAAATTSMKIPDILAAGWSASFSGPDATIEMTKTSMPHPGVGALDTSTADFDEQTQYDVFCWAHDDAVDGRGYARPNQQTEEYVNTEVGQGEVMNATLEGGKTPGVWVADTTPPTMLLVQAEALRSATLQVRLQLNEPGTVWCAAAGKGSPGSYCLDSELQSASSSADCFFEDYIKGNTSDGTSFSAYVSEAFQDVEVEITRILRKDMTAGSLLLPQTTYQIFCFAEDDWKAQADSVNSSAEYVSPTGSPATTFVTVQTFSDSIGELATLDEAAPSFTLLEIQDPSAEEGVLVVNFALNEAGTAYCRATRSDSGESAEDMPINRVLTANWVGEYDGSSNVTIVMNNLENVDPSATKRDDEVAALMAGTQYDVYCWAKDEATNTFGYPQPNFMAASYVASPVLSAAAPAGGYTRGVWVTDSTPPTMFFSAFDALSEESLLVQLQLSEPGTVWCAATMPNGGSSSYCRPNDLQDSDALAACYYEDYIKGSAGQGTVFMKEVSDPYTDVSVEIDRIALSGIGGAGLGAPLPAETQFSVLCFAQDSWDLRSQDAFSQGQGSPNFVAPGGPNKVTMAQVLSFVTAAESLGAVATTLDLTAPSTTSWALHAPPDSESSLEVLFGVDEAATLFCLPLLTGAETPHISTITAEGHSANCSAASFDAGDCSSLTMALPGLLRGTGYDVHCQLEDDNMHPLLPNRRVLPVLSASVNDFTPPEIRVVRASGSEPGLIVVTLQLDEPGTVWCFSPSTVGQVISPAWVLAHGWRSETAADANTDVEVTVSRRGTTELQLVSETAYETYCAAQDTAANPSCTDPGCPAVPNLNTLAEMQLVRDAVGQIITRDVDPPTFSLLGARGVGEDMLSITLQLNEPGTAYCRATRTDAASTALHISHIVQAGFYATNDAMASSVISIDKLADRATEAPLTRGTAYDIFCWAKDSAQLHSCRPQGASAVCSFEASPNFMEQSYVQTRFSQTVHPPDLETGASGGLIDMVRTWDTTPPVLTFVWAEARSEDSMTATLQLDEPGTAYCRAYDVDPGSNVTFADVVAAPGGPFSFDLPSDSPLRSFTASAQRNFEITVTGLSREVLYFVYCVAEDDEATDGCFQRNATESPDCGNNEAAPILTEPLGRYSLDLTPPTLLVLDAVSYTQDSVRVTASLDEAGTVWCAAVLDLQPPPATNEVVAAGYLASIGAAGVLDVTIQNLMRDTEYDVYCFARDDGTMSAANSTLEVKLSKKNSISYSDMVATKMDAHVIYDSEAPRLLAVHPPHNAFGVGAEVNISLTFSEDIQAGNGTIELLTTGEASVALEASEVLIVNAAMIITGSMHGGLALGKTWRLLVPNGALTDRTGQA
ncbi:unnamed protein product [Symbiodinium necroappetens]|uniref:SbsA Ig-like domain-containing protein n=1 Tax=Symbiodinium necroappetens TaxID=1628268 RepID=A0A813BSC4_9DINO|nr:unnamed protein product [Symbiodinium necroappetens]